MMKIEDPYCLIQALRHLLCEERKRRGLSQFELAKKSGLTRQCIALFESGKRIPTFFSLFNLAKGFGMPTVRLMALFMDKLDYYERQEQKSLAADSKKTRWLA